MNKNWFESKTLWVAILQFVVGGLAVTGTNHPDMGWILMIKSVLDFILRLQTDTGIN